MPRSYTTLMILANWEPGAIPEGMTTACQLWRGTLDRDGYGRASYHGRRVQAHKFVWELKNGKIPEGFEVDHLCRVRRCINLQHLELVSKAENLRRRVFGGGNGLVSPCNKDNENGS